MDQAERLKIAFITPEMAPLAKTGGLADVTGALPKYLSRLGQLEVTVWLPCYREIKNKNLKLKTVASNLKLNFFPADKTFSILEYQAEGFKVYLIENDFYFGRDYLYGTSEGDYPDNGQRFAFFCLAALTGFKVINWPPDLIHAHDWQSALTLAYLKHSLAGDNFYQQTRSLFTIHNLAYQGLFPPDILNQAGLPGYLFNPEDLEFYGRVNFLKAGLLYSQAISTVSPTYSQEIQSVEFGFGLDGVLIKRSDRLFGILNGIDYQEWDPASDPALPAHYSSRAPAGKFLCRQELLRSFNFEAESKRPVVGLVSRLAGQKGFDLLVKSLDEILKRDLYLIILGTGEKQIQEMLSQAARKYPERFGLKIAFDDRLARLIYAGSDFFLIPSRYEPCGLTQMYSLRYGTIPVVRSTGGLKDSIQEFDPDRLEGNGFRFEAYEPQALLVALDRAISFYQRQPFWSKLKDNAFKSDFSWEKSAANYYELYLKTLSF
jgi:starch synthase